MEYFEIVAARRSVRSFTGSPVEPGKLDCILEMARLAPSAGNLQAYEIYAVTAPETRAALARAAGGQEFLIQAPVALVFCAHPARSSQKYGRRGAQLYALQDATIACTYAQLAATALGLGTVWVGAFDDAGVSAAIGVGEDLLPVAILPVGYAAEAPESKPRRSLEDLVHPIP
jgi:nitroreductase